MSTSTEATVRAEIVTAIRSVAKTELGFDNFDGNIKDYLLEFEREERAASYLVAQCGGKLEIRCWAVQVTSSEEVGAMGNISRRNYTVTVKGYYSLGSGGSGYKLLIDHIRAVRAAIKDLGTNLSGLCDRMLGVDDGGISVIRGIDAEGGAMLEATMVYRFDKLNPDY